MTKLTHDHVQYIASLKKYYKGMGTTLSALLFVNKNLFITHVGDSRIYRLREKKLELISVDHIKFNPSKKSKNGVQSQRKCLTQAVGSSLKFNPHIKRYGVKKSDRYLICSDGLTDLIDDQDIMGYLSQDQDLSLLSELMIQEAKTRGGHDNITVVLLDLQ